MYKYKIGQRFRWIYSDGSERSDMIVEIIEKVQCGYNVVVLQVMHSTIYRDKIGYIIHCIDICEDINNKWFYLQGQDKICQQ